MNLLAKKRPNPAEQTEEQKTARNRVSRRSKEWVTSADPFSSRRWRCSLLIRKSFSFRRTCELLRP
jgi:hypothetical protein